jgi:hypothetical protein
MFKNIRNDLYNVRHKWRLEMGNDWADYRASIAEYFGRHLARGRDYLDRGHHYLGRNILGDDYNRRHSVRNRRNPYGYPDGATGRENLGRYPHG